MVVAELHNNTTYITKHYADKIKEHWDKIELLNMPMIEEPQHIIIARIEKQKRNIISMSKKR